MKRYAPWLAAATLLAIVFGTIYAVVQQAERQGANFPQVQLAEDSAVLLNQGLKPDSLTPNRVNMESSLAPFIIVYDTSGRVVAGSGYLNGSVPTVPKGVLTAAKGSQYHAVTWQPEPGTRIAAVAVAASKYYVLSGRSLYEVEKTENVTFRLAFLGGVLSMAVLAVAYAYTTWPLAPKRK